VRTDPALTQLTLSIPGQLCRLLQHVTDYLLDIRLRAGIRPARERMETMDGFGRGEITRAVALCGEETVAQTIKKRPGNSKITEEDWNRYVDAIRRKTARNQDKKHP
jgi:hypothetical protein